MAEAVRTNPTLWEQVKAEITAGDKGGDPGEWSARKAQMAVREYKKRGGGYDAKGPRQEDTNLHHWTEEEWGTKSGGKSEATGERYLPRLALLLLTEEEYARTTARKRGGRMQFVDQPEDIREKVALIRKHGPTREMLDARARELRIEGAPSMDDRALLKAIEAATDENGRAKGSAPALRGKSKAELLALARERGLEGRSRMTKEELALTLGG
jgi:hypothetical protein